MPNIEKRVRLSRYIQYEISSINSDIRDMLIGISKGKYENDIIELSIPEIKYYLSRLKPLEVFHEKGEPVLGVPHMTHTNFYIYFTVRGESIIRKIDKIISFQDVLDSDTLQYLSLISYAFKLNDNVWKGALSSDTDASNFHDVFMNLPLYIKKLREAGYKNWYLTEQINYDINKEEIARFRKHLTRTFSSPPKI